MGMIENILESDARVKEFQGQNAWAQRTAAEYLRKSERDKEFSQSQNQINFSRLAQQ